MSGKDYNPLLDWKTVYEELLDPITTAVDSVYLPAILENQLNFCKKTNSKLSLAVLRILSLPMHNTNSTIFRTYTMARNITNKINEILKPDNMIFYDGVQTFSFLLQNTDKPETFTLLKNIETALEKMFLSNGTPLLLKCGYAVFPTDAKEKDQLQEHALKALIDSTNAPGNRIMGYFDEKRHFRRAPLQVEVRYYTENSCERLTCSRNISEEGIMLNGLSDLPTGKEVKLSFCLPYTIGKKITLIAKTIWSEICQSTGKINIGLFFTDINSISKEHIRDFIKTSLPPIIHL
jgi:GGDEF domain-containing protein